MNTKEWLRTVASLKPAQCRELGELLISIADDGPRDAAGETLLQDYINSLPDPDDGGMSAALQEARLASGRCCSCGRHSSAELTQEKMG